MRIVLYAELWCSPGKEYVWQEVYGYCEINFIVNEDGKIIKVWPKVMGM